MLNKLRVAACASDLDGSGGWEVFPTYTKAWQRFIWLLIITTVLISVTFRGSWQKMSISLDTSTDTIEFY